VTVWVVVVWVVTLLGGYKRFGKTYRLDHQGRIRKRKYLCSFDLFSLLLHLISNKLYKM
jgi:hypothetical protein